MSFRIKPGIIAKIIPGSLVIVILILFLTGGHSFNPANTKDPLEGYENLSPSDREKAAERVFNSFNLFDTAGCKQKLGRLIRLSLACGDKGIYIHSMNYYSDFLPDDRAIQQVNRTFKLASDMKDEEQMGETEKYRSFVYKRIMKNDSAIVSLLRAIDIFENIGDNYDLADTYHVLGDMYYNASLYDKARTSYYKALNLKGNPDSWKIWRKFVITNNLGLVESSCGNYDKALEYFNSSLNDELNRLKYEPGYNDSLRLPYLYKSLAQVYFKKNDIANALRCYTLAFKRMPALQSDLFKLELWIIRGRIFNLEGKHKNALAVLLKALETGRRVIAISDKCALYEGLADTYRALGNENEALKAEHAYFHLKDSLDKKLNRTAFLETIAAHDYEKFKMSLSSLDRERLFLASIIFIVSLFSGILVKAFLTVRRKNRLLIDRNIRLAYSLEGSIPITFKQGTASQSDEAEESKSIEISRQLEILMHNEKVYLDTGLSLNTLAEKLNISRENLSRVINTRYNKNFSGYVNEFRINEAIRIMTSGEMQSYSLEGVANTVGFSTRASFINAFKKQTGVTPSAFINRNN